MSAERPGFLAEARKELFSLLQNTSLGRLVNRIIVGQQLTERAIDRRIDKAQENEMLRRGDQVIASRRAPDYRPNDLDRVVAKKVKEIQRGESETWIHQTVDNLERRILSLRGADGRLLLVHWALGQCPVNSSAEGDQIRDLLGIIEALKIKRNNMVEHDQTDELIQRLNEQATIEAGGTMINLDAL